MGLCFLVIPDSFVESGASPRPRTRRCFAILGPEKDFKPGPGLLTGNGLPA